MLIGTRNVNIYIERRMNMYINFPDHPEVAMALRTGFPRLKQTEECCVCGAPASCAGSTEGLLCTDCALDTLDALKDTEKLELLGFELL